jgi:hypothetical protein
MILQNLPQTQLSIPSPLISINFTYCRYFFKYLLN